MDVDVAVDENGVVNARVCDELMHVNANASIDAVLMMVGLNLCN